MVTILTEQFGYCHSNILLFADSNNCDKCIFNELDNCIMIEMYCKKGICMRHRIIW